MANLILAIGYEDYADSKEWPDDLEQAIVAESVLTPVTGLARDDPDLEVEDEDPVRTLRLWIRQRGDGHLRVSLSGNRNVRRAVLPVPTKL